MNSVLLVGEDAFTEGVRSQVRGLSSLTVTAASTLHSAKSLLESQLPDVLLVQASTLINGAVTQSFEAIHSVYVIVVETTACPQDYVFEEGFEEPNQDFASLQLEKTASALESGADAYLWLPPADQMLEEKMEIERVPLTVPASTKEGLKAAYQDAALTQETTLQDRSPLYLFPKNQCRLIQAHVQIGLRRAQRYRDLSRINDWLSAVALIDALTQINNRRAFDLELPNQIAMARNKGTALSILVLDIDFFKRVNDRYGHLVGDDVLRLLAKRLSSNMRFYDTPFRYGGEEFVVTLNNTDKVEGKAIANRLRELIGQEPFRLSQPVGGVSKLDVTVSIGLTELRPEDDAQGRSFLHRADQNLLQAKESGRNRVVAL